MSKLRNYIELLVLFSAISSYQNITGVQISLTRAKDGDYFRNAYAEGCDDDVDDVDKFCIATNSKCYPGFPRHDSKCCYCRCHLKNSTFDPKTLACAPNEEFRKGCALELANVPDDKDYLNAVDLSKDDIERIGNLQLPSGKQYKLLSCSVSKVQRMGPKGYENISAHPFGVRDTGRYRDFIMNWPQSTKKYFGRVFRITFTCQYKNPGKGNAVYIDCLMLKSSGSVQIYHPGLPSDGKSSSTTTRTPLSSSQPTTTTQETSTSLKMTPEPTNVPSSSSPLYEIWPTSTAEVLVKSSTLLSFSSTKFTSHFQSSTKNIAVKISTTQTAQAKETADNRPGPEKTTGYMRSSIVTEPYPTLAGKEEQGSDSNGDNFLYIIVVAAVVVVVLAVLVLCLMLRKQKRRSRTESRVDVVMSDLKENLNEDENGLYTALEKSGMKEDSNYQALTLPGVNKKCKSVDENCNKIEYENAGENIYVDADRVYSTIEPPIYEGDLGAQDNSAFYEDENERVYSILEEKPGMIAYPTPGNIDRKSAVQEAGRTVDAAPVYSNIEESPTVESEADYVIVLPPQCEPNQSDCSIYAELSEQREENNYESLVKRKN